MLKIRSLDDLRLALPHLGCALYAMEPQGLVTLEIYAGEEVFSFLGDTEAAVFTMAFPGDDQTAPDNHDQINILG